MYQVLLVNYAIFYSADLVIFFPLALHMYSCIMYLVLLLLVGFFVQMLDYLGLSSMSDSSVGLLSLSYSCVFAMCIRQGFVVVTIMKYLRQLTYKEERIRGWCCGIVG